MNKVLLLAFLLFSYSLLASPICQQNSQTIITLLSDPSSRIAFKNQGGLLGKGVCWWHSRLQRSSAYLAEYKPDLPPPDVREVRRILTTLMQMNGVTIIPGFHNFESFSMAHQREIQKTLNYWQKVDGFFNFVWIQSISGNYQLRPEALEARMNMIYSTFQTSPQPLWVMAQIKGITSHSLLLLGMEKNANGFRLTVIDSNHPGQSLEIYYHFGDTALQAPASRYAFIPYVGFQNDYKKIFAAVRNYCGQKADVEIPAGEVELTP
ncbi:MAG TPA: hypothetical protein VNJ01_07625 [Bacteriovoracaceae bacterium]|nr:hypothetical protein [Bacteriovoracaceae bacterium]